MMLHIKNIIIIFVCETGCVLKLIVYYSLQ